MELKQIDKARFKKHLNWFQGGLVVLLLGLSLGLSELYIQLWSDGGSNFWLNAAAVATAAALLGLLVSFIKDRPELTEVMYVWRLKQELNRIYRSSKKLEKALEANQHEALVIKYFQLHGSKHLYQLEDNTLTLSDLYKQIEAFEQRLADLGKEIRIDDYRSELLERL